LSVITDLETSQNKIENEMELQPPTESEESLRVYDNTVSTVTATEMNKEYRTELITPASLLQKRPLQPCKSCIVNANFFFIGQFWTFASSYFLVPYPFQHMVGLLGRVIS
jgi:hypothetical protein